MNISMSCCILDPFNNGVSLTNVSVCLSVFCRKALLSRAEGDLYSAVQQAQDLLQELLK